MADYVLSILPSKLCAATALCSKLILDFTITKSIKSIDLYKCALWNKILVLCVITKHYVHA